MAGWGWEWVSRSFHSCLLFASIVNVENRDVFGSHVDTRLMGVLSLRLMASSGASARFIGGTKYFESNAEVMSSVHAPLLDWPRSPWKIRGR